jgi:ribosomal protein L14E/L6E/L27E
MELRKGSVVRSKAGRDKDKLMAVIGMDGKALLLCDGKERRLEKPKRKNPRHTVSTEKVLKDSEMATNRSLRRALAAIRPDDLNSGR